jgi:hypothetical protein
MKHQDAEAFVIAVPVQMTRRERLARWADLVRAYKNRELILYHAVEYWSRAQLRSFRPIDMGAESAFTLAVKDPSFQQQGLAVGSSIADVMSFFSLSQGQLHDFSCDCGGYIDNRKQAERIERLAG